MTDNEKKLVQLLGKALIYLADLNCASHECLIGLKVLEEEVTDSELSEEEIKELYDQIFN